MGRSRMGEGRMWIVITINERNSSDAKRRSRYVHSHTPLSSY